MITSSFRRRRDFGRIGRSSGRRSEKRRHAEELDHCLYVRQWSADRRILEEFRIQFSATRGKLERGIRAAKFKLYYNYHIENVSRKIYPRAACQSYRNFSSPDDFCTAFAVQKKRKKKRTRKNTLRSRCCIKFAEVKWHV